MTKTEAAKMDLATTNGHLALTGSTTALCGAATTARTQLVNGVENASDASDPTCPRCLALSVLVAG